MRPIRSRRYANRCVVFCSSVCRCFAPLISHRESPEYRNLVHTFQERLETDGFLIVPAVEPGKVDALHARLCDLVKGDKNEKLRRENFTGRAISGEGGRLQAIKGDFHAESEIEWLAVSAELGKDVCTVLTALLGESATTYNVHQPATLFSVARCHDAVNTKKGKPKERQGGGRMGYQRAHRDYSLRAVRAAIARKRGKVFRAFGCLVALESGTRLRVYPGSHVLPDAEVDACRYDDVHIPKGFAIIFYDTLVHLGVGFLLSNLRHHFHANAEGRNTIPPPGDTFAKVTDRRFDDPVR